MTGIRLLAAFDKPLVRVALDWMTSLGFLGLIGGIGLGVYLSFTGPTAPQIETGQIFAWESHSEVHYVRHVELVAMNAGFAVCGPMCFIGKLLEQAILGPMQLLRTSILTLTAIVSVAFLFMFVRTGGAWPYAIAS
jgi:hypothetical protein